MASVVKSSHPEYRHVHLGTPDVPFGAGAAVMTVVILARHSVRGRTRGIADSAGVKCLLVGDSPAVVRRFLSYPLCYHQHVAQRDKRSVSFPPELAKAIDEAAAASGTSFSAWISETASHRLRLQAGRQGVAEWEAEHGPLSERELAEGLARARELLGRAPSQRSA